MSFDWNSPTGGSATTTAPQNNNSATSTPADGGFDWNKGTPVGTSTASSTPATGPLAHPQAFGDVVKNLGQSIDNFMKPIIDPQVAAYSRAAKGQDPISTDVQAVGQGIIGGVGNMIGKATSPLLKTDASLAKGAYNLLAPGYVKDLVSAGGQELAKTDITSKLSDLGVKTLTDWNDFSQKHPTIANDISGTIDIASIFPAEKIADAGTDVVKGAIKDAAESLGKSAEEKALENITLKAPEMTTGQYGKLAKSGKIIPKSGLKPATVALSDTEKDLATKYAPLLQSKDPVVNMNKVLNRAEEVGKQTEKLVADNNKPVVKEELANEMVKELAKKKTMNVSNKDITDMVDKYVADLKDGDIKEVYNKRNAFTTDATYTGNKTTQKSLDSAARRGIQNYLDKNIPEGAYKKSMDEWGDLLKMTQGKDSILYRKVVSEKGENAIKTFVKKHPWISGIGTAVIGGSTVEGIKKIETRSF